MRNNALIQTYEKSSRFFQRSWRRLCRLWEKPLPPAPSPSLEEIFYAEPNYHNAKKLAAGHLRCQEWEKALEVYEYFIDSSCRISHKILYSLGNIHFALQNYTEAIVQYQMAIAHLSEDDTTRVLPLWSIKAHYYQKLASVYYSIGDRDNFETCRLMVEAYRS